MTVGCVPKVESYNEKDHMRGSDSEYDPIDFPEYPVISEKDIRREKEKARRLRQSNWWMRKIQKGQCYYCRQNVGKENLTMDHVLPLSRGGKSRKGNIVQACKTCNNKKKYLLPIEWDDYLKSLSERARSL